MSHIALTTYDWVYGIIQVAVVFLSIIAGLIALSMFHTAHKQKLLAAWKPLIISLVLFAVEEVLGSLKAFGFYSNSYLTHVIPSFILIFLIAAVLKQTAINKGWLS